MHKMPLSFWFSETDSYLHIVNLIGTPDKNFKDLRDCLEKSITENSVYQIPISWVLLSLKIQKMCCEQKVAFLQFKSIEKIWNNECKQYNKEELNLLYNSFTIMEFCFTLMLLNMLEIMCLSVVAGFLIN